MATDTPTTPAEALAEQERLLKQATDAVNEMLRGKLWLHVKTGGVYLEYGRGDTVFDKKAGDRLFSGIMGAPLIEATDDIPAGEMFVRYRNVLTGEGWARPARLFDDGRFIPLTLAPAAHAEALELLRDCDTELDDLMRRVRRLAQDAPDDDTTDADDLRRRIAALTTQAPAGGAE